ncbi:MAG TPA: anhydro-N-acetylmuramic acid kinase, partial [Bacteroidales bacterium]|nr:anhydro-N-acetylmuramic acid kinase [Bacteroidales bacterium]
MVVFHALGLMSGTSLDGLDVAYCRFSLQADSIWNFQIIEAETVSYPDGMKQALQQAMSYNKPQLRKLSESYAQWMGEKLISFIESYNISNVDFIASHGHTVFHQPENGITVQIGDGQQLADTTGLPVISNFRMQDVVYGGQGAPLVPIGDKHLFADYDQCLNIGGFSNISMEMRGERVAWDICPVNTVGNDLANRIGLEYDENGKTARQGAVIPDLLDALNALPFYREKPPKSLGREWVSAFIEPVLAPYLEINSLRNVIRTWYEHAAIQIAAQLQGNVLVTGGGAKNAFLMQRIRNLSHADISIPEDTLVDYKEALIFAFMGVLRCREEINVLASVTGA